MGRSGFAYIVYIFLPWQVNILALERMQGMQNLDAKD